MGVKEYEYASMFFCHISESFRIGSALIGKNLLKRELFFPLLLFDPDYNPIRSLEISNFQ